MRIGLISDTHGLLRPSVMDYLKGADHIIHAGDIGHTDILARLSDLAPLTAVRGNNDHGVWADALPECVTLEFGATRLCVLHDIADLDRLAPDTQAHIIIAGHSHKPAIDTRNGRIHVNPGSAGRRRFKLPISAGELILDGARLEPKLREFAPD